MRPREIAHQSAFGLSDSSGDDPRPVPPARPAPEDCCGGGCSPCIFEQYDEAMQRYEEALERWNERKRPR